MSRRVTLPPRAPRRQHLLGLRLSRVLKNSLLPRLLKKVQMQGGVTHPGRMGTRLGGRRTWSVRRSAARARGYPPRVGLRRWAFFSSLLGDGDLLAQVHILDR